MANHYRQGFFDFNIKDVHRQEDFLTAGNQQLVELIFKEDFQQLYIWGKSGVGKSHLLMALATQYSEQNKPFCYLPLKQYQEFQPEILQGLNQLDLICLDDIDVIFGNEQWELAIFHLYNQYPNKLLISSSIAVSNEHILVPDLASRMQWGLTFELKTLQDDDLIRLLKQYAMRQAMPVADVVYKYLINHYSRNTIQLIEFIKLLSNYSLEQKKKVSIKLVKELLVQP